MVDENGPLRIRYCRLRNAATWFLSAALAALVSVLIGACAAPVGGPSPAAPTRIQAPAASPTTAPNTPTPLPPTSTPVAPTPTAELKGTAQPMVSGSTMLASTSSASTLECLGCHPYAKLVESTADYATAEGTKVNPHTTVELIDKDKFMDNPHAAGKTIVACANCHKAHSLPSPAAKDIAAASVEYCFFCHHTGNFSRCIRCHQ